MIVMKELEGKTICARCAHSRTTSDTRYCLKHWEVLSVDYVTGSVHRRYAECGKINTTGECTDYEARERTVCGHEQ